MQDPGWIRGRVNECFQCGKTWETAYLSRRPILTITQTAHLWWGFRPVHYTITQLQSLCPYCTQDHDAKQQIQRQKRLLLIGGTGVGFFSWLYLGTTGLLGAVIIILAGAFYRRRARNYLPQLRGNA